MWTPLGESSEIGASFRDAVNSGYLGWQDALLPGFNVFNKMFDFTGSSAAQQQYANQQALNEWTADRNSSEAQAQRDWEMMMDSTKYQRMAKDLEAAGLNPYAMFATQFGGAGGTPSGSSASVSSGSADMANNKLTAAAGVIALVLRMILTKGK